MAEWPRANDAKRWVSEITMAEWLRAHEVTRWMSPDAERRVAEIAGVVRSAGSAGTAGSSCELGEISISVKVAVTHCDESGPQCGTFLSHQKSPPRNMLHDRVTRVTRVTHPA